MNNTAFFANITLKIRIYHPKIKRAIVNKDCLPLNDEQQLVDARKRLKTYLEWFPEKSHTYKCSISYDYDTFPKEFSMQYPKSIEELRTEISDVVDKETIDAIKKDTEELPNTLWNIVYRSSAKYPDQINSFKKTIQETFEKVSNFPKLLQNSLPKRKETYVIDEFWVEDRFIAIAHDKNQEYPYGFKLGSFDGTYVISHSPKKWLEGMLVWDYDGSPMKGKWIDIKDSNLVEFTHPDPTVAQAMEVTNKTFEFKPWNLVENDEDEYERENDHDSNDEDD